MWSKRSLAILLFTGLAQCTPHHDPQSDGPGPRPKPASPQSEAAFTSLRKMSLHLRGETPDRSEYQNLARAIEKGKSAEYLQAQLDHYLASDQHIDKMTFRMEELFALRASGVPFYSSLANSINYQVEKFPIHNAMNELMRNVISRNLSWDTLLTGKNYTAFPPKGEVGISDLVFYAPSAHTPVDSKVPVNVKFADNDPRVAGLLTTSRFFGRYVNTALNKNRKRAAAVFRAFLCDDMKAVVVSEKGNEEGILDRVFPQPGHPARARDAHGTDPACLKCHYKLDPMGQTFQSSGMMLAPLASPGALVFTSSSGRKINIPVSGLGELAEAITNQDEYLRCQVRHFWRWFIGDDKPLSENIMMELTAKFNNVRRRPNDFIAYLMNWPEFGLAQTPGSNGPLVAEIKGILKNCNGCHGLEGIPSFTNWPIDGSDAAHAQWISRIRWSLALDGSNRPRPMPPASSGWQPTPAQLATIQQWLDLGAPNE